MHSQQLAPHHQNFYPASQSMNPAINPGQYLATHGGLNLGDFSRGSPLRYANHEYHFSPDRGGPLTRISSSTVGRTSLNATGTGISDIPHRPVNVFRAEGIARCQQPWQSAPSSIHGHAEPMSAPLETSWSPFKGATINTAGVLRSPTAQLPTPAAMAVLLNPNTRSKATLPLPPPLPMPPVANVARQPTSTRLTHQPGPGHGTQSVIDSFQREKKHACTMCHKRFDRPSTLRKHLLVHTGEKAFVCETCGRRFGVASNLNRHVRRCILKPVNTGTAASSSGSATESSPSVVASPDCGKVHSEELTASLNPTKNWVSKGAVTGKQYRRTHALSPSPYGSPSNQGRTRTQAQSRGTTKSKEPTAKRRRRAPSPSHWIPLSLLAFNLTPDEFYKSTPVPLPPVTRAGSEERDSWDENVDAAPYHPSGWKNKLPGPGLGLGLGLGARDVRNLNLGGSGGFMLGRVVVF